MIDGAHVIVYSHDAEADRAFFRDVLEYPHLDAGGGWLIFKLPPAELAVHPADAAEVAGTAELADRHELYLMCSDLDAVLQRLSARGVEFSAPVTEARWGRLTRFRCPAAARWVSTNRATRARPSSSPPPTAPSDTR
jgi:predicted enzyme related to lactoylglutathione lyase